MKKIFTVLMILLCIGMAGVGAAVGAVYYLAQPVNPSSTETVNFVIPKGQAIITIASRLKQANLIRNELVFRIIVKKNQLEGKIQAGSFELTQAMSAEEIATQLTKGTVDLWVTIPEGWRREEIAASLAKLELTEFDEEEFLSLTVGEEGKLFPDSYLVPRMITTEAMAKLLTNTFDQKVEELEPLLETAADNQQLIDAGITDPAKDFTQILVMASILEREAKGYEQMRTVAGILYNRLAIDMALQVDASLQYVKGYNEVQDDWWMPPLAADKKLDSPFNTYLNTGLPPRPICNPGLEALKAALDPQANDYLYYLHDRQGKIHFAATIEEHNQNINKYLK